MKEQIAYDLRNLSKTIESMKKKKNCNSSWIMDEIDKFSAHMVSQWAIDEEIAWFRKKDNGSQQ